MTAKQRRLRSLFKIEFGNCQTIARSKRNVFIGSDMVKPRLPTMITWQGGPMAVIFCATTALWLWRSTIEMGDPLSRSQANEVLKEAKTSATAVRAARSEIANLLNGRWTGSETPDVLGKPSIAKSRIETRQHLLRNVADYDLYPVPKIKDVFVASVPVSINQVSLLLGFERTALLMLEFCGTYRLSNNVNQGAFMNRAKRTSKSELYAFAQRQATQTYRAALGCIDNGSASPVESSIYLLLSLPSNRGGYGFPRPDINATIELDDRARRISNLQTVKPDFLWRDQKAVLEYDSNEHHFSPKPNKANQALVDNKRAEALKTMGYETRSLTAQILYNWTSFNEYVGALAESLGCAKRQEGPRVQSARSDLYALLLFSTNPLGVQYNFSAR
jgi:hypothetical protein